MALTLVMTKMYGFLNKGMVPRESVALVVWVAASGSSSHVGLASVIVITILLHSVLRSVVVVHWATSSSASASECASLWPVFIRSIVRRSVSWILSFSWGTAMTSVLVSHLVRRSASVLSSVVVVVSGFMGLHSSLVSRITALMVWSASSHWRQIVELSWWPVVHVSSLSVVVVFIVLVVMISASSWWGSVSVSRAVVVSWGTMMHIHSASSSVGSQLEVVVHGWIAGPLVALVPRFLSSSSLRRVLSVIVPWRTVVDLSRLVSVVSAAAASSASGAAHASQSLSWRMLVVFIIDDFAKLLFAI